MSRRGTRPRALPRRLHDFVLSGEIVEVENGGLFDHVEVGIVDEPPGLHAEDGEEDDEALVREGADEVLAQLEAAVAVDEGEGGGNNDDAEEGVNDEIDPPNGASAHPAGERGEEEQEVGLEPVADDDEPPGLIRDLDEDEEELEEDNVQGRNVQEPNAEVLIIEGGNVDPAVQNIDFLLQALGGEQEEAAGNRPLPAGGERGEVNDWIAPEVPEPRPVPAEDLGPGGWRAILKLGAWNCIIPKFGALEELPAQHRAAWSWAWEEILRRLQQAEEGSEELNCCLLWLLFLPQALCRKPEGRGGLRDQGYVNQRFKALSEGNWGELVRLWEIDVEKSETRVQFIGQREETEEQAKGRKKREVVKLLGKGQIHRAVDRINSNGVADMADPAVLQQVLVKHPPRWKELPATVEKTSPVETLKGLRSALQSLKRGGSPGSGGLRAEYLTALAESIDNEGMQQLEQFGLRYLSGQLPPWFYSVFLSSQAVALYKTVEQVAVRPIGVRHSLLRVLHREVVKQNRGELVAYLEPEQQAMSEGGCQKVAFMVRTLLEENEDFICLKLDVENAQNSISRAKCVEELQSVPQLSHLAWHAATILAPSTILHSKGRKVGEGREGFTQGDPEATPLYCTTWHRHVQQAEQVLKQRGGAARFLSDDGYLVGPKDDVVDAFKVFEAVLRETCGLRLQVSKCELFSHQP